MLMKSGLSLRQQGRFTALFPSFVIFLPHGELSREFVLQSFFVHLPKTWEQTKPARFLKTNILWTAKKSSCAKLRPTRKRKQKVKALGIWALSLYVSIPFCPSRCHYCSFVSHSVANAGKLVPKYVELLTRNQKNGRGWQKKSD